MTDSITSAFITILASSATVGLGAAFLRIFGFVALPPTLFLGASYGVGMVSIGTLLHWTSHTGVALSMLSWVAVAVGIASGAWVLRGPRSSARGTVGSPTIFPDPTGHINKSYFRDPVVLVLVILVLLHLAITLGNNVARPIFPWDAFTTWMYRAKAWVLQDSVSTMAFSPEWIAAGGTPGYGIYASQYPAALSVYTAFMSALTGTWTPAAASTPWTLCLLAMCMTTHGALRAAGTTPRLAVVGAYMLCSLPLMNIHAALAGYGDLWMALFSGGGLALLLAHRLTREKQTLWLALLLMLAGTQIKTEGWIWLGLGLLFLALESTAQRIGYFKLIIFCSAFPALLWAFGLTHLSLGPLGKWGLDSAHLHVGPMGTFALRPYNPVANYFDIVFQQPNFLLLGGAYAIILVALPLVARRDAAPFWTMGCLIGLSQAVIFGLSSFSVYAETGTAITRLLLQFTPVLVISVIIGWQRLNRHERLALASDTVAASRPPIVNGHIGSLLVLLLVTASLLAPGLWLLGNGTPSDSSEKLAFDQSDFVAAVGRTKGTDHGRQFTDSPINVGVLKAPLPASSRELPRYLLTDLSLTHYGDASFYWVLDGESDVQRISLGVSGPAIEDLSLYPAWDNRRIKEAGYLVQEHAFSTTAIRSLSLKDAISWLDLPAVVNQWMTAEPTSHRLINHTLGHAQAPVPSSIWLTVGGALLAALGIVLAGIFGRVAVTLTGAALLTLWTAADLLSINSSEALSNAFVFEKKYYLTPGTSIEKTIDEASRELQQNGRYEGAVLIVATDESSQLAAQRLPFDVLPRAAAHIDVGTARSVAASWPGPIVLFGANDSDIQRTANKIMLSGSHLDMQQYSGFAVIAAKNP